jgi:hypothetical protein
VGDLRYLLLSVFGDLRPRGAPRQAVSDMRTDLDDRAGLRIRNFGLPGPGLVHMYPGGGQDYIHPRPIRLQDPKDEFSRVADVTCADMRCGRTKTS